MVNVGKYNVHTVVFDKPIPDVSANSRGTSLAIIFLLLNIFIPNRIYRNVIISNSVIYVFQPNKRECASICHFTNCRLYFGKMLL